MGEAQPGLLLRLWRRRLALPLLIQRNYGMDPDWRDDLCSGENRWETGEALITTTLELRQLIRRQRISPRRTAGTQFREIRGWSLSCGSHLARWMFHYLSTSPVLNSLPYANSSRGMDGRSEATNSASNLPNAGPNIKP